MKKYISSLVLCCGLVSFSLGAMEKNMSHEKEDMLSQEWIKQNTKQCPQCKVNIERIEGGCDIMNCTQCKKHFCWVCSGEHKNACRHKDIQCPGCKAKTDITDWVSPSVKCKKCKRMFCSLCLATLKGHCLATLTCKNCFSHECPNQTNAGGWKGAFRVDPSYYSSKTYFSNPRFF